MPVVVVAQAARCAPGFEFKKRNGGSEGSSCGAACTVAACSTGLDRRELRDRWRPGDRVPCRGREQQSLTCQTPELLGDRLCSLVCQPL